MKKLISLLLILTLLQTIPLTAFAAGDVTTGGTDSAVVTGTYKADSEVAAVYSVDITWEGLSFTYTGASKGIWNAETHQYEGNGTEASWGESEGSITITNHSNAGITAKLAYVKGTGFDDVTMTFASGDTAVDQIELGTADNGANGAAGTAIQSTITVTPAGSLPETTAAETKIGTITITIS